MTTLTCKKLSMLIRLCLQEKILLKICTGSTNLDKTKFITFMAQQKLQLLPHAIMLPRKRLPDLQFLLVHQLLILKFIFLIRLSALFLWAWQESSSSEETGSVEDTLINLYSQQKNSLTILF